ncbi:ABC transporter permease subunit [Peribacillus sp. SCS-26]|uniref:ABC transporter permease subunit n=1 Tax=Paraperibacillus marinus TaxID=3115295 RepID=UPI003905E7A0
MIRRLLITKRFLAGTGFLACLLIGSFVWERLAQGEIKKVTGYYEDGQVIASPPYPPSLEFWLGSNEYGYDLFQMLVYGAKYSIGVAFLTAGLQLAGALVIGTLLGGFLSQWIKRLEPLFDSFYVVPTTLIAFFILRIVLWMPQGGFQEPFWQRALFEILLLVLLALPALTIYCAKEIKKELQSEHIEAARVLGGSSLHILAVHVFPATFQKWILLFLQQFTQVLLLMAYLGVFQLFFGGTFVDYNPAGGVPPASLSNEWAGILGNSFREFTIHPWLVMGPVIFMSAAILAVKSMASGIERAYAERKRIRSVERDAAGEGV